LIQTGVWYSSPFCPERCAIWCATQNKTTNSYVIEISIRSIIDAVEVDDKAVRIIGSKDVLQAVIAGAIDLVDDAGRGGARKAMSNG
jgi:hypothetical protein